MIYIYSDSLTALDNMILDSYLIQEFGDEYFRLYKWSNPTLSLGVANKESEINLQYINNHKIDYIRRETGGGIVFHNEDLCFSFISDMQLTPKKNYFLIKNTIEKSLIALGEVVTDTNNINIKSPICFKGSNNHEISIDNKKVIGIAQKVIKNRYLIQGSIQLKTTSLKHLLSDSDRPMIQYGLNNIEFDTIKGCVYRSFAKIYNLTNIIDLDIVKTEDYFEFKQKNKHRFKGS